MLAPESAHGDVPVYRGVSYCDAVRRAGEGELLRVMPDSIEICGWSPVALGLKEPESRFERSLTPRLDFPNRGLLLGPLDRFPGEPDLVLVRASPETLQEMVADMGPEDLWQEHEGKLDRSALPFIRGNAVTARHRLVGVVNGALAALARSARWQALTHWLFRSDRVTAAFEALISHTLADMSVCRNSTVIPLQTGRANISFFCTGGITWGGNRADHLTSGWPWETYQRATHEAQGQMAKVEIQILESRFPDSPIHQSTSAATYQRQRQPSGAALRPLFDAYPALRGRVPFVELAELPTPLEPMDALSARTGANIWVKRDGLSHPVYGGNKVRKFEFILGDAVRKKAKAILTGGGLGSHHTLATAVLAREYGLQAVCAYYCQPISEEVHRNLRSSVPLGIDAHFCGDYVGLALSFAGQYIRWLARTGRPPYFVYPGGSGVLGVLGYVNAALEVVAQLEQLGEPEPEAVFVPAGSCGTFAGLMLGARLAGLGSRIVGVRIIEEDVANRHKVARLANRASRYLWRRDPSLPRVEFAPEEVELLDGYIGPAYAHPTRKAERAVKLAAEAGGLPLETTYTGKTMAALLDHAESHPGARLLFMDTYNEAPTLEQGDYHALPERFWPVFDAAHKTRCWCLRGQRDAGFCWKRSYSRD